MTNKIRKIRIMNEGEIIAIFTFQSEANAAVRAIMPDTGIDQTTFGLSKLLGNTKERLTLAKENGGWTISVTNADKTKVFVLVVSEGSVTPVTSENGWGFILAEGAEPFSNAVAAGLKITLGYGKTYFQVQLPKEEELGTIRLGNDGETYAATRFSIALGNYSYTMKKVDQKWIIQIHFSTTQLVGLEFDENLDLRQIVMETDDWEYSIEPISTKV